MKKLIIGALLFGAAILAQEKSNSVELPDFVITGVQSVEIPLMKKNKIDMISIINKEFILPSKVLNEIKVDLTKQFNPPDTNVNFIKRPYNGVLKIGVGNVSLPKGEFLYSTSSRFAMIDAKIWGYNEREYKSKAGYNVSGAKINGNLFVSGESGFLPGSQLSATAGFLRDEYNFFASANPEYKRKTSDLFGSFSFENTFGDYNVGATLKGNNFKMEDIDFNEQKVELNGFVNFNIKQFAVNTQARIVKQFMNNSFSKDDHKTFVMLSGLAKIKIENNLELKGGISVYDGPQSTELYPTAFVNFKINDRFSAYGFFNPKVNFYTIQDFSVNNRYFIPKFHNNIFEKVYTNFGGTIKYSLDKFVEIGAGFRFYQKDNDHFYEELPLSVGSYTVQTESGTKNTEIFIDAIFHRGPYGTLSTNITYCKAQFENGKYIPYRPELKSTISYYYNVEKYHLGASFIFYNGAYTDKLNTDKISSYMNLSVNLKYELFKDFRITFDVENLLNKENFLFKNYSEKTVDVILGIDFRW